MKGVTGPDWASFCLRKVATSVWKDRRGRGEERKENVMKKEVEAVMSEEVVEEEEEKVG